jgi:hypothetical protein
MRIRLSDKLGAVVIVNFLSVSLIVKALFFKLEVMEKEFERSTTENEQTW